MLGGTVFLSTVRYIINKSRAKKVLAGIVLRECLNASCRLTLCQPGSVGIENI